MQTDFSTCMCMPRPHYQHRATPLNVALTPRAPPLYQPKTGNINGLWLSPPGSCSATSVRPPFCQQWRQLNGNAAAPSARTTTRTTNGSIRKRAEREARQMKDNKCVLSGTLGLSGGYTASVNGTTLAATGCSTLAWGSILNAMQCARGTLYCNRASFCMHS